MGDQLSGQWVGASLTGIYFLNRPCSSHSEVADHSSLLLYPIDPVCFRPSASAGCLQWPLFLSTHMAHVLHSFPERTSSIIDLTMPTSGLTSYLWLFVIQRGKLSSLARSVSPVLSYTPTQKATFLSVPTRVTQVLTWTHFLPILGLYSGQFLLFSWLPTLPCQFPHHWAQALLHWEIPLIHP